MEAKSCISIENILGSACDIFGFGHNPIADKRDALDPYMFHLCIENESSITTGLKNSLMLI